MASLHLSRYQTNELLYIGFNQDFGVLALAASLEPRSLAVPTCFRSAVLPQGALLLGRMRDSGEPLLGQYEKYVAKRTRDDFL